MILDGVFSHTGEDSRYFNRYGHYDTVGAYQSKESPWYDWYTFRTYPTDYACWWNIPSLPEVKEDHPDYQRFMFQPKEGIVPRWLHAGASGWRLDVADELPMDFLRALRTWQPKRAAGMLWCWVKFGKMPATKSPMGKCATTAWAIPWTAS